MIGEEGPEAVVPLNRTAGNSPLPSVGASASTPPPPRPPAPVIQVVAGPLGATSPEIQQAIVEALNIYRRNNGKLPWE